MNMVIIPWFNPFIIFCMTDNKISQLIPLTITSLITSLLTKEMLTPLVLLGRTYNGRSMPVQAGLIIVFAILYFLVFWKVLQPLFARIPALRLNQQFFFVMILLLTVSIMSKELFIPGMIEGYDIDYHMLRIESLSAGIKQGQFPVRVNPVFLNGFGYASSLFYPDLLLYFPAALRALGLSTILSAKLFLMTIFTLCFLSASWAVRRMTGSSFAGLISAVVYCLSQYLLQNVYRRGAMGEVQAFIFLPLIVYGLYSLVFERFEKHWVMAIGFIGLLYSHLISALIGAIVVSAISLFHLRKILTDKVRMLRIIKFSMITLGITIAFWLPLIEQLSTGSFKFSQSTYMARSSAVPISAIFAVTGRFSGNHVVFGLPTLILCLLWFVFQKYQFKHESHQIPKWGLGIGAVLLFIVTDFFPWHWMNGPLNIIQFPWPLYSFAVIFLAGSIGVMLDALIQENWRRVSLIALVAFLGIPAIWVINVSGGAPRDLPDDFYRQTETTFRINNSFSCCFIQNPILYV